LIFHQVNVNDYSIEKTEFRKIGDYKQWRRKEVRVEGKYSQKPERDVVEHNSPPKQSQLGGCNVYFFLQLEMRKNVAFD